MPSVTVVALGVVVIAGLAGGHRHPLLRVVVVPDTAPLFAVPV